jgi:hypothetical protein
MGQAIWQLKNLKYKQHEKKKFTSERHLADCPWLFNDKLY